MVDADAVGEALFETRRHIWMSAPPPPRDCRAALAAYRERVSHSVPPRPPVSLGALRRAVMSPAGSGVGVDGMPYEVFHLQPVLVAALVGQAFLQLERRGDDMIARRGDDPRPEPGWLDSILGPPHDLLIWIPKERGNDAVGAQRPLNLPTCLRRLYGGAGMHILGPAVEPGLTDGQAARAGGSCQRNIRRAFAHLESAPQAGTAVPHVRWACEVLFGPATDAVLRVCHFRQHAAAPVIQGMPVCFLLDQEKAFEWLSHDWFRQVLDTWELPGWAKAFFLSAAEGRRVSGAAHPPYPGEAVRRGVGMGGPASPCSWSMSFDPISWLAQVAAGCLNNTYVDDLEGETWGPGQALLLYLCLLAAAKLADLRVADHGCVRCSCPRGAAAAHLLACFPGQVQVDQWDRGLLNHGPVDVLGEILCAHGGWAPQDLDIHRTQCRCKTKHCLIPSSHHALWAEALARTPLAAALKVGARYLGAHLTSRAAPGDRGPPPGFVDRRFPAGDGGWYLQPGLSGRE